MKLSGRPGLSAAHASYWNLLGIEVWVRSDRKAATGFTTSKNSLRNASVDNSNRLHRTNDRSLAQRESSEDERTDRSVSASLRGFRLGKAFVVISEDVWVSRKMVADVARSINSYRKNKREDYVFKWPQIEHVDDTFASMIRAFESFLRSQKVENDVLIAAGEIAGEVVRIQTVSSDFFVISNLPKNGKEKRFLWEQIRKLL